MKRWTAAPLTTKTRRVHSPISVLRHAAGATGPDARQRQIAILEAGLARWPDHPSLLAKLALLVHCSGDKERSAQLYARALAHNDRSPATLVAIAELCIAINDLGEAERCLLEVRRMAPDHREALAPLIGLYQRLLHQLSGPRVQSGGRRR